MTVLTVPERVERILGDQIAITTLQIVMLGQLVAANASAVVEIEGIARQIRELSDAMQRNRDERAHLQTLLNDKLASVLADPYRYMPEEGDYHGEASAIPEM